MGMCKRFRFALVVVLAAAAVSVHAQVPPSILTGAEVPLSGYLIGACRAKAVATMLQVVNPTPYSLWIYVATFQANGSFVGNVGVPIGGNGVATLMLGSDVKAPSGEPYVVKVVSVRQRGEQKPVQGIIGYLSQFFRSDETKAEWSERVPLAAVPTAVLQAGDGKELKLILQP